jgi:hypothetical protein
VPSKKKPTLDELKPVRRRPEEGKGTPGKYSNGEAPYQPTEREIDDRVAFARDTYLRHRFKSTQIKAIRDEFGVSRRTAETYLSRARQEIRSLSDATWMEKREASYEFYLSIVMDETKPPNSRIKAQGAIDKLFGLDAPIKIARTDSDGNDLDLDGAADRVSALAQRIADRRGDSGSGGGSPGN